MAECPFCGEQHPLGPVGPVGEPGSFIAGIEVKTCPRIPDGFLYFDDDRVPRGQLVRVIEETA